MRGGLRAIAVAALLASAAADAMPAELRVILVGDSTLATRNGYGDALCANLRSAIDCINLARNGRSSLSFREDGSWDRAAELLRERAANRATYVLIEFGHNDQPGKPGRSTDLAAEFGANLARYVGEVREAGATAVLVTPLTRRSFSDGKLTEDLAPWADVTRRVAREHAVPLLDLYAESAAAVRRMGPVEADRLAVPWAAEFDHTHLGPRGAAFFARIVARELAEAIPALAPYLAIPPEVSRPKLTAAQALRFSRSEVLARAGDAWDPLTEPAVEAHRADLIVDPRAADGHAVFATVQAAVNAATARAAHAGSGERVRILLRPGVYRELVYVPESSAPITLEGDSSDAAAVRIVGNLDATITGIRYSEAFGGPFAAAPLAIAAMFESLKRRKVVGTPGSAVAWIRNREFEARNLTFENAFNKDRGDDAAKGSAHVQAVALMVDDADRVRFDNVRFVGYQDTLYLKSSSPDRPARVFIADSYVEGDMDFIFGEATAYFLRTEIRSLGDRPLSYTLAPSTDYRSRYGFVFAQCRFTNDGTPNALAGKFKLARQWRAGGSLAAVGKVAILDSRIGAHIDKERPWADWGTPGEERYRPVQYDSRDLRANLAAARTNPAPEIDPGPADGPGEPYLAEHGNTDE